MQLIADRDVDMKNNYFCARIAYRLTSATPTYCTILTYATPTTILVLVSRATPLIRKGRGVWRARLYTVALDRLTLLYIVNTINELYLASLYDEL